MLLFGIGLNINGEEFQKELKEIATSLKKEFAKEFSRKEILAEFLNEFEKEYLKLIWNFNENYPKTVVKTKKNWYTYKYY